MTLKFFILFVPAFIFAESFEVSAQNRQMKLSDKDRREIFRRILQDTDFSEAVEYSSNETVYLSTINIPLQLQSDFPEIKGVKFRFITPREIENLKLPLRIFYFGEFKIKSSTVAVYFGEFYSGSGSALEYIFRKSNGTWRFKTGRIQLFTS